MLDIAPVRATSSHLVGADRRMRQAMHKSWYVIVALALLATTALLAQEPVTFNLNSLGSGSTLASAYTSPYTGSINGGPTIDVICDDFADNTFDPEEWTAY